MKKLTFALFVAFGATMFVSCGPKIDTPENLGKSLLEAVSSQDKEAFTELFISKEEMTTLFETAGKTQMDEAQKTRFEEVKTRSVASFEEVVTKEITTSYDGINEKAKKENINWDKVEFVRIESKEDVDYQIKSVNCKVFFKTDTATDLFVKFSAVQIGDDWKIVNVGNGIGGSK
jgi:hypothetical protein